MGKYFTAEDFSKAYPYEEFVGTIQRVSKQVATNKTTGKATGGRGMILDFSSGAKLHISYGVGGASKAPYANYVCMNIYWDTTEDKVRLAIALENYGDYYGKSAITEYPELDNFANVRDVILPGKGKGLAVQVLEYPIDDVNYAELYDGFIKLCAMFDHREVETGSDIYLSQHRPNHLGKLLTDI
jgi:hypothetical protein